MEYCRQDGGDNEYYRQDGGDNDAAGLEALAASETLPRLGYLGFSGNVADDPTPRFADEYDADLAAAAESSASMARAPG